MLALAIFGRAGHHMVENVTAFCHNERFKYILLPLEMQEELTRFKVGSSPAIYYYNTESEQYFPIGSYIDLNRKVQEVKWHMYNNGGRRDG